MSPIYCTITYFPYVLSEDVLKHYGHTERPSGEIGEGILFSDRENIDVYELLGEKKALEKENALLKEEYDYLKQRLKLERHETHGAYLNKNQLNDVAKRIRNILTKI